MMKSCGDKLFENWIFENYLKARIWKSNFERKNEELGRGDAWALEWYTGG